MKVLRVFSIALVLVLGLVWLAGSATVAQDTNPETIYRAAYDAFNEGDGEGGMALFAENIIGVVLPTVEGTDPAQIGKESFQALIEDMFAINAHWEFDDFQVKDNTVTYRVIFEADGFFPLELRGFSVVSDGLIELEAWSLTEASRVEWEAVMERAANEEAVRRYMDELWSEGDLSVADEVVSEDFVSHWSPPVEGREALKESVAGYRAENPGAYFPIEDLVMTDDKAYITNRMWVIPEGAAEGDKGEPVTPYFFVVLGVEDGQITERWFFEAPGE